MSILAGDETLIRDGRGRIEPHTKFHFSARNYSNLETWKLRKERLRRQILVSSGLWPMPERGRVPSKLIASEQRSRYVVDTVMIETLPGFFVGANVYRPRVARGKSPGIMIAHGHWKKGRVEHSEVYSVPALGANLAARGYVAMAYDMVGYGDTKQLGHEFGSSDEAKAWAFHPLGLQLWNSLRIFDWLAQRRDVDAARIAMTGASGGGTQTYLLAAVEERLRAAIPAVMISFKFQGDDACEMAPGLRIGTNNVEIAGMMAPRPMLVISTSKDWTEDTPTKEFPALQKIYRLHAAESSLASLHQDVEHGYNAEARAAAYRFLGKLFGLSERAEESESFPSPPDGLLAGDRFSQKEDEHRVLSAWKNLLSKRNERITQGERVTLWRTWSGGYWPAKVQRIATAEEEFLHRAEESDLLRANWQEGEGTAAVLRVEEKSVPKPDGPGHFLGLKLFGGADAMKHGDYLVFHHADTANRIQDLITGMAWLEGTGVKRIRLECAKGLSAECAMAAKIAPVTVDYAMPEGGSLKLNAAGAMAVGWGQ